MTTQGRWKQIAATSIGNFGEIYDFAVFGLSVPILARHFFPGGNPASAILSTFAVYAAAFFARPLGGLVCGVVADRAGRIKVLSVTIWLMAGGTAAIGLIPTSASIGIAAPVLLVICRLAQGFALGGETTSSTTYVIESASEGRRGLWVGTVYFFANFPNAFVALLLAFLQYAAGEDAYTGWVWRVPFLLGGVVGIVGSWLRRRLDDPDEFKEAVRSPGGGAPLQALSRQGLVRMAYVALILPVQTVGSYLIVGFMFTFLVGSVKLGTTAALLANAVGVVALAISIPVGGEASDRFGRKPVLTAGAGWIAVLALPAIWLTASGSWWGAVLGQVLVSFGVGLYSGAAFTTVAEIFPTSFRATGHAISYQVTVAVLGGTTPLVGAWLISLTGSAMAPGIYVTVVALVSLVAIQIVPETRNAPLRTSV